MSICWDDYEPHDGRSLVTKELALYTLETLPLELAKETQGWAGADQSDDWDFSKCFECCDFLIAEVNVKAVAEAIIELNNQKCLVEKRLDWLDTDEIYTSFDDMHRDYMEQCIYRFKDDEKFSEAYSAWWSSTMPIVLNGFNDDPVLAVIEDGWHRFNCAYASGRETMQALLILERKDRQPYRHVWAYDEKEFLVRVGD